MVQGRRIAVGNARYFSSQNVVIPEDFSARIAALQDQGKTSVIVGELDAGNGSAKLLGAVAIADVLRSDAAEVIQQLKADGIERVVMLTGDNARVAQAIAKLAGVDEFHADLLPEDKVRVIKELKTIGPVAMVGDGTNDAPALAQSDVAVVMNSGTQAAKEAGNMIDLDSDPTKLIEIVEIGKQLLMTRGSLTTFSIANDLAKYFAIIPAAFAST
jgi:K+-transporting ATPase ATPase B chain